MSLVIIGVVQIIPGKTPVVQAAPSVITVLNTNDSGAGSLRAAIATANGNGNPSDQDIIRFDINSDAPGDVVITPQTPLVITQSVLIDGYTQGDAVVNTAVWPNPFDGNLRLTIDGSDAGSMQVTGDNVTIRGINFANSIDADVTVTGSENFQFLGNYTGTTPDGMELGRDPNTSTDSLVLVDTVDARVGGVTGNARNIFGYCARSCVKISGSASTGTVMQGNYIGLAPDGITSLDTTYFSAYGSDRLQAVVIDDDAQDVIIGGTASSAGNSFEHNASGAILGRDSSTITITGNRILYNFVNNGPQHSGIVFQGVTDSIIGGGGAASNTISGGRLEAIDVMDSPTTSAVSQNITIENNNIGVMSDGTTAFPNYWGVIVEGNSEDVLVLENRIRNATDGPGVWVKDNAQRVSVLGNSINNNHDEGIQLAFTDPADTNDTDTGPNNGLNAPGYTEIVEDGGNTEGTFTMDVPAGDYRVEFFSSDVADPDFPGEGQVYIDSVSVTSAGTGLEEFDFLISGVGHDNLSLTATEENTPSSFGYGATSQFGTIGEPFVQNIDLSVNTTLQNPEDARLGNTLDYQVIVTNGGPDNLDLSDLNEADINSDYLFMLVVPSGLTYSNATGTGISCVDSGLGSAGGMGTLFTNHASYSVVTCAHTGGTQILAASQSVSYTLSFAVTATVTDSFSVFTIANTPDFDLSYGTYQNAINSGNDIIDEAFITPYNNFDQTVYTYQQSSDLSAKMLLLNPEDFVLNGMLNYQITITNNGPDAVDIGQANDPTPGQGTDLFTAFLPPQISFSGSTGNITCNDYGPIYDVVLPNHLNHNVVACAMTGGAYVLSSGQSVTFTLSADVNDITEPSFFAHIMAQVAVNDPDVTRVGYISSLGGDIIDGLSQEGINNYARAWSQPADLSLEAELTNPQDVGPGATLTYEVSVINNGPSAIDPRTLDASSQVPFFTALFSGLLAPNLTYVSSSNPDVLCTWAGPGSASLAGPLFAQHLEHSLFFCGYNPSGPLSSLASGERITTILTATTSTAPDTFESYFFTFGTPADQDFSFVYGISYRLENDQSRDILDFLQDDNTNGFVLAAYTAPGIDPPGNGDSVNGGANAGNTGGLGSTGQRAIMIIPLILLLLSGTGLLIGRRKVRFRR